MPGTSAGVRKGWRKRKAVRPIVMTRGQIQKWERRSQELAERRGGGYVSGLEVNLQTIDEEYVPALQNLPARAKLYQQMANEAKIAAQLRANILPLMSAVRWSVEGGTPEMRDLV